MIDQSRALDAIDKREYVLSKMRCEYQKLISQTKRVILDIIPTMTTTPQWLLLMILLVSVLVSVNLAGCFVVSPCRRIRVERIGLSRILYRKEDRNDIRIFSIMCSRKCTTYFSLPDHRIFMTK